jgi:hypothetical protein
VVILVLREQLGLTQGDADFAFLVVLIALNLLRLALGHLISLALEGLVFGKVFLVVLLALV